MLVLGLGRSRSARAVEMVLLDEADGNNPSFCRLIHMLASFHFLTYLLLVLLVHPQGFPAGSDALNLRELVSAVRRSTPVNNEFLKMKPEDIPRVGVGSMYCIPSASLISLLVMASVLHRSSN